MGLKKKKKDISKSFKYNMISGARFRVEGLTI